MNDPQFRQSIETYRPNILERSAARFRNNNELKYSLRSIKQFFNFRRIFIVTNGQKPDFLDAASSEFTFVDHRDIFSDHTHLPTFNSHAIECNLHHIEGLSETFMYFNDDLFVCRPLDENWLLGPDGLGRFILTKNSIAGEADRGWGKLLQFTESKLVAEYGNVDRLFMAHTPQLFVRSLCAEVEQKWLADVRATSSHRFRSERDINFRLLYSYFAMYRRYGVQSAREFLKSRRPGVLPSYAKFYSALKYPGASRMKEEQVMQNRPFFLCIQDNAGFEDDQTNAITRFLEELFPRPGYWETTSN